jgi:CPA1 family monovalent cation:H+ antiporter
MENGSPFPGRDLILFLTFCVILATLGCKGLACPGLFDSSALKTIVRENEKNAWRDYKQMRQLSSI